MKNNQKGISLIALIITIIVIIILAAIVISSAVNTPEQANWARFCGNYAEIQSAVSTRTASVYGDLILDPTVTNKPSTRQVLYYVVTGTEPVSGVYQDFPAGTNAAYITSSNKLGLSGFTFGANEWAVDDEGVLYNVGGVPNPNDGGTKYSTPTVPTTSVTLDTTAD